MSALNSAILHSVVSEDNQIVSVAFCVAAFLATTAVYYSLSSKDEEHGFPKLPGIQLYHAWNFIQRRNDFLDSNFKRNSRQTFSFDVGHHKFIALTGEDARRLFYSDPRLDLREANKFQIGMAPRHINVVETETSRKRDAARFNKTVNKLFSKDRMQNLLPTLLQDITGMADKWGSDGENGRIDPFVEIFELVPLMIARIATCHDLAKNEVDLGKITGSFWSLRACATPTALILPWFPSLARVGQLMAHYKIFRVLSKHIEARRRVEPTSDAIDVLIAEGETTRNIVQFALTVFFAGIANTSIFSCWTLIHLAVHHEWREKCKAEIQDLLSRYLGDSASFATTCGMLNAIPFSAWEDELPTLEACARESQRLSFTGAALRRNVREDIDIGGKVVRRGDFLMYPISEVHLDPGHYPEPHKYDPGRWLRPDSISKAAPPFLAWGTGRHPCPGMKVAKFEMKLIVAMFLIRYEYELVDEDGGFPDPPPVPNRDDSEARPLGSSLYFKFKKVIE